MEEKNMIEVADYAITNAELGFIGVLVIAIWVVTIAVMEKYDLSLDIF